MKKKLCIVTGTRAEYGLFLPLLQKIKKDNKFILQIIATGMHLLPEFGLTYREIERDGFRINAKVDLHLLGDSDVDIDKAIGRGISVFAASFQRLKPDLIMVLGDRFETFAATVSSFVLKIPIVHLYGGEVTEGVIDDAFRHAITKMSYLHFTSTEEYSKRVIQLGEDPRRVFTVGALGIDNIKRTRLLNKSELEKVIKFKFGDRNVLVTYHPVTLERNTAKSQFKELLSTLDIFQGLKVIFTKPNADVGSRIIIKLIEEYVKNNPNKAIAFSSLGQQKYLSTVKYVDTVIGNSSSGIIEVPSFGKPTVNIGDRQKGRIKAKSVIDCNPSKESIFKALRKAFTPQFREFCKTVENPYGDGRAAKRIMRILKKKAFCIRGIKKSFYNLR